MECFAGVSVSLRSCEICVADGKGAVMHERELPCEIEEITGYLTALWFPIVCGSLGVAIKGLGVKMAKSLDGSGAGRLAKLGNSYLSDGPEGLSRAHC